MVTQTYALTLQMRARIGLCCLFRATVLERVRVLCWMFGVLALTVEIEVCQRDSRKDEEQDY